MIKSKRGIYEFALFQQFPQLVHGFSTRELGSFYFSEDQTTNDVVLKMAKTLQIDKDAIVLMNQVHGDTVATITNKKEQYLPKTDGLITKARDIFLCVRVADCVPLLLYDPIHHIAGAVHVGWRGALKNIAGKTVEKMISLGADVEEIRAGIGPSIRSCCYDIQLDREILFAEQFPALHDKIIEKKNGKTYLNLQSLVRLQLTKASVLDRYIEDSEICTADHTDEFFSYREKDIQGRFAGIIGVR